MSVLPFPEHGRSPRHVLLVDDEFDTRFVARLLLEDAGYAVVEAANGTHALERLAESRPDVLVCDLDMPGMGGLELLDRIRSDEQLRSVPVLLWSEHPPEGTCADAVLAKGGGIQDLVHHVNRLAPGGDPRWSG